VCYLAVSAIIVIIFVILCTLRGVSFLFCLVFVYIVLYYCMLPLKVNKIVQNSRPSQWNRNWQLEQWYGGEQDRSTHWVIYCTRTFLNMFQNVLWRRVFMYRKLYTHPSAAQLALDYFNKHHEPNQHQFRVTRQCLKTLSTHKTVQSFLVTTDGNNQTRENYTKK